MKTRFQIAEDEGRCEPSKLKTIMRMPGHAQDSSLAQEKIKGSS